MNITSTSTTSVSSHPELLLHPECRTVSPIQHHESTPFVHPIKRKPFQTVRFAPLVGKCTEADCKNVFPSPHKELTEQMIRTTWYSKEDIVTFQKRSKLMILLKAKYPSIKEESKLNESVMGLERFHPKRAAYKRAAMKFTLDAQQKTRDPNFLAAVAQQCSKWARSAAFHQALQNYCDVYNTKDVDSTSLCARVKLLQSQESSLITGSKADHKGTKRSFEGDDQEPAQKRRRVARSA